MSDKLAGIEKLIRIGWKLPGYKKDHGRWSPISKQSELEATVKEFNGIHGEGTHWIETHAQDINR